MDQETFTDGPIVRAPSPDRRCRGTGLSRLTFATTAKRPQPDGMEVRSPGSSS
jgi:hypothetical protein